MSDALKPHVKALLGAWDRIEEVKSVGMSIEERVVLIRPHMDAFKACLDVLREQLTSDDDERDEVKPRPMPVEGDTINLRVLSTAMLEWLFNEIKYGRVYVTPTPGPTFVDRLVAEHARRRQLGKR